MLEHTPTCPWCTQPARIDYYWRCDGCSIVLPLGLHTDVLPRHNHHQMPLKAATPLPKGSTAGRDFVVHCLLLLAWPAWPIIFSAACGSMLRATRRPPSDKVSAYELTFALTNKEYAVVYSNGFGWYCRPSTKEVAIMYAQHEPHACAHEAAHSHQHHADSRGYAQYITRKGGAWAYAFWVGALLSPHWAALATPFALIWCVACFLVFWKEADADVTAVKTLYRLRMPIVEVVEAAAQAACNSGVYAGGLVTMSLAFFRILSA